MQDKEILTIKDVAEHLQVSERTVLDWAQKGEIPCGKLGNSWRFKRVEVERWIDARLAGKPVAPPPAAVGIGDVFAADRVLFLEKARKPEVLNALIDCLSSLPNAPGRAELAREILLREELMSTGMGLGVAIPHVRLASLDRTLMAAAVVRKGVPDYESMDGQPVRLVFMIAAGHHQHGEYLRLLSSLANLVKDEGIRESLIHAADGEAFFSLLQ